MSRKEVIAESAMRWDLNDDVDLTLQAHAYSNLNLFIGATEPVSLSGSRKKKKKKKKSAGPFVRSS